MDSAENGIREEEGYRIRMPERSHPLGRFFSSRTEIELRPEEIRVREIRGPLQTRWKHRWDEGAKISVQRLARGSKRAVCVEFKHAQYWIGAGYSESLLQKLAKQLTASQQEWRDYVPPVGTVERSESDATTESLEPQISSSGPDWRKIRVDPSSAGVRITVPPAGLRKGTHGLWIFFLLFFSFPISVVGISAVFSGTTNEFGVGESAGAALIYLLVSGSILAPLWNMGKRSAILEIADSELRIERRSIFGVKEFRFPASDVSDIRRANSSTQINGRYVQELQVHINGKRTLGMLTQRKDAEIQLVVDALRLALREALRGHETDAA